MARRLLYRAYHVLWQSLDLLLPPTCGGCGRRGERWCMECQAAVREPSPPLCELCGQSRSTRSPLCTNCQSHRPHFSMLRSWALFANPIRPALHRLKYRGDIGLAEALVPQLAAFVRRISWTADLLVPVPLAHDRLRQRGYNQAGLISWPLSLALDLRHAPRALERWRETASQVGLSRQQRHENVRGAFSASSHWVGGQSILLLDDVATTGATLSACAEALLAAGARDVFALTVARAYHDRSDGEGIAAHLRAQGPEPSKEAI